ncbi:TetR/AcrR family transcriptional regulator [Streptomyces sp. NPDC051561]|uniref:TetR/AcrR family transcriptional regulator n=1 Tax=Streptomyces sp. NPDC051561 TaxID=3365658 RepID=UPI00378AA0E0
MPETKPPDSSRRSDRSRRAIYDAALALVAELGYPRTTIEGIAARAGVGKQTIYRWWPSKAAVLLEAFVDLGDQAAEAVGEVGAAIPDTGDLAADLRLVLRATVDELVDPKYDLPTRALAAEGIVDAELCARYVEKLLRPSLQLYVDRLAAARAHGDLRTDLDLDIAVELLTGPLSGRWMMRTGPLTHDYADRLVDYVLGGLTPR